MYTLWLQNIIGQNWNLVSKNEVEDNFGCLFYDIGQQYGMSNNIKTIQVQDEFMIQEILNNAVNISGKMLFTNLDHKNKFVDFIQNFNNEFKIYYDPKGYIYQQTQIEKTYYKRCIIQEFSTGGLDPKTGVYICNITFNILSTFWKRANTVVTTTTGVIGDKHIIPFYYPYFYVEQSKLITKLINDGDRTGCIVKIYNKGNSGLTPNIVAEWAVKSENNIMQYAKWLNSANPLTTGKRLVVDSNIETFSAVIEADGEQSVDVQYLQELSLDYINFVDLYHGENIFTFNIGNNIEVVDISVEYNETKRVL